MGQGTLPPGGSGNLATPSEMDMGNEQEAHPSEATERDIEAYEQGEASIEGQTLVGNDASDSTLSSHQTPVNAEPEEVIRQASEVAELDINNHTSPLTDSDLLSSKASEPLSAESFTAAQDHSVPDTESGTSAPSLDTATVLNSSQASAGPLEPGEGSSVEDRPELERVLDIRSSSPIEGAPEASESASAAQRQNDPSTLDPLPQPLDLLCTQVGPSGGTGTLDGVPMELSGAEHSDKFPATSKSVADQDGPMHAGESTSSPCTVWLSPKDVPQYPGAKVM
jgi:hypothetical protein